MTDENGKSINSTSNILPPVSNIRKYIPFLGLLSS